VHGVKIARKHVGWYLAAAVADGAVAPEIVTHWRPRLMRESEPDTVLAGLRAILDGYGEPARDAA
jgi:hypothetical protein